MTLTCRSSTWYLERRVPRRYRSVEPRPKIKHSLATDSRAVAERKAEEVWARLVEGWEALLDGDTADAERQYEAARNIAQAKGFRFLNKAQVLELPFEEIAARLRASADRTGKPNMKVAAALLGKVEKPKVTLNSALEAYWPLTRDRILGKSDDQVRRWKNPRIKAMRNLVSVTGDLALEDLSADDMQDFRDWLLGRVEAGEVKPSSANKDLVHIAVVLRTVSKAKRLGLDLPLSGWTLKEEEKRRRPSFSSAWIRDTLLAPGALDRLNSDARCLLLGMVNTGYRPSEGACLGREQIRLDAEIPHISIEPVGRTLKSYTARRLIPLHGVSLEAFQAHPEGFTRYTDSASATQLINNYLESNGLKETPQHTLYSLRHSFQDRMIAAGIDDRIRREIFGHALTEETYGEGASLEHRARLLAPISFGGSHRQVADRSAARLIAPVGDQPLGSGQAAQQR